MEVLKWILTAMLIVSQAALVSGIEENRETITQSRELLIGVDLDSSLTLKSEDSGSRQTEYIEVNLSLFPKEGTNQDVVFLKTEPLSELSDDYVRFRWEDPELGKHRFSFKSNVITRNEVNPVTGKVEFPVSVDGDEARKFIRSSDNINVQDPEIVALANSLAEGEDDLFKVVYKIAKWSNRNIEYNLSTLTAEVTKPASWVLRNRIGVCDELTNLFIALNRALGIPVKFVHGISYTDSELFEENWGFHGWAEVYFPGYGWIPFDVTYGQYGFVDAGHVKLGETVDASDLVTTYGWRGYNVKVEVSDSAPKVTLKRASGTVEPTVEISSRILKKEVGFGSHNLEEVTLRNLRNHYVTVRLLHGNTRGLEFAGETDRVILLKPNEVKYEYFGFKVLEEGLKKGFIYTFPLTIKTPHSFTNVSFKVTQKAEKFGLEELDLLKRGETESKKHSKNLELECAPDNGEIYVYEKANISCSVTN